VTVFLSLALAVLTAATSAQQAMPVSDVETVAGHAVSMDFVRAGLTVPHWSIAIHEDGSGRYEEIDGADKTANTSESVRQSIRVSHATLQRLGAGFDAVSAKRCETKAKHVANTGQKTIVYKTGPEASVNCTFNYSDDEKLQDAANAFLAIAATMQMGAQLAKLHRYDRLGLDAQIQYLDEETKAGRASDVQNIAAVLKSIAEDDRVIDRVRRMAARMLTDAGEVAPVIGPR
jgi:hypothetical protein